MTGDFPGMRSYKLCIFTTCHEQWSDEIDHDIQEAMIRDHMIGSHRMIITELYHVIAPGEEFS